MGDDDRTHGSDPATILSGEDPAAVARELADDVNAILADLGLQGHLAAGIEPVRAMGGYASWYEFAWQLSEVVASGMIGTPPTTPRRK